MVFSDPPFFVFLLIYLIFHFLIPARYRIYLIIVGSALFYSWWRVTDIWLPFALAMIAWSGVRWFEAACDRDGRRRRLAATICFLFAPLVVVKYGYFISHEILGALPVLRDAVGDVSYLKFALPLGISFVTFTLTAYVVDVYTGRYKGTERVSTLLGYVLFFPHLIAGPILRPNELMPQLRAERSARGARFVLGVAIFTLGLVKKLIFADTIGESVDSVFLPNSVPSGWEYLLAFYGFAMQIYCDFSGYTDMAIGVAYILRIRLPTNFAHPYTSTSVIEFWRRWHITLSHWLRDYLYIPLGGNRQGDARRISNLLVTMVLGGLWHGANITFVLWGLMHGLALAISHLLKRPMQRLSITLPKWLAVLLTFHFVSIAWIYFRAPDIGSAQRVLAAPFRASWNDPLSFAANNLFPLLLLVVFFATHGFDRHARLRLALRSANMSIVWVIITCFWILAIAVRQGSSAKFIYFDF
jgi:alginate O-acetyltransferase complex protein AlgI